MSSAETPRPDSLLAAISDLHSRFDTERLTVYLQELLSWNPQLGLVTKRTPAATIERLVRRSVATWDLVSELSPRLVADIGSGGGFPGIVWKLLSPQLRVVLIERKERRALFLERVAARLGMRGLAVVQADAADRVALETYRGRVDGVVMLAVTEPATLAAPVARLLRPGGFFANVRPTSGPAAATQIGGGLRLQRTVPIDGGVFVLYILDA